MSWLKFILDFDTKECFRIVNENRKKLGLPPHSHIRSKTYQKDSLVLLHKLAIQKVLQWKKQTSFATQVTLLKKFILSPSLETLSKKYYFLDECLDLCFDLNERSIKTILLETLPKNYLLEQTYLDYSPELLYTPYRILKRVFKNKFIQKSKTLIDLGSGLGRVGIFCGLFYPRIKFMGIEIVKERHQQAKKMAEKLRLTKSVQFECQDLNKEALKEADTYFLFNSFNKKTLKKVLPEIKGNLICVNVGPAPDWIKKIPDFTLKESLSDKTWEGKGVLIFNYQPT